MMKTQQKTNKQNDENNKDVFKKKIRYVCIAC